MKNYYENKDFDCLHELSEEIEIILNSDSPSSAHLQNLILDLLGIETVWADIYAFFILKYLQSKGHNAPEIYPHITEEIRHRNPEIFPLIEAQWGDIGASH